MAQYRVTYDFQCATCGGTASIIWVSDRLATDEDVPMTLSCKRQGCVGMLNRAKPVRLYGPDGNKVVGRAYISHDADLIIDINPDLLTSAERFALRPDQAVIPIKIPERLLNG